MSASGGSAAYALDARTAEVFTALATNLGLPGPSAAVVTDEEIAS